MDEAVKSTILLTYNLPSSNRINPHLGRILAQKTLVLRLQNSRCGKLPKIDVWTCQPGCRLEGHVKLELNP